MGTKNQVQTVQQSVPSWVSDAYKGLISGAQTTMAQHPYTPYTGGFEQDQQKAFQNIGALAGSTDQTFQNANSAVGNALTPAYQNVQNYMNPYVGNVVNATMANMKEMNGQQQQGVIGNAIAKGAMGGNRVGVAQGELARQQGLANNQTIAGLWNDAYSQALGAAQQQQQTGLAGAGAYSSLGQNQMNTNLTQAAAQLGAGTQQQQYNYQQFLNQQGFPYQQQSWLSGVINGTGPNAGGTTTQTTPGGNIFSSLLGAGLGVASLFNKGGVVPAYAGGGSVHPYTNDNHEWPQFRFDGTPFANDNAIWTPYIPDLTDPSVRASFPKLDPNFGKDQNDDPLTQYSSVMKKGAGNVKNWLTGAIHPDLGLASGGSVKWRTHIADAIANGNESNNIEDRRRVGDPIADLIRTSQAEAMRHRYMGADHFSHDPSMPSDRFGNYARGGLVRGYDGGGIVQSIHDFLQAPYAAREAAGQVVTPGPVDWGGMYKTLQAPYEARQARLASAAGAFDPVGPGLADGSSGMAGGWNQFDDQFGSGVVNPNANDSIVNRPPPTSTSPYTANAGGNSLDITRLGLTSDPFKTPAQKAIEIEIHGGTPMSTGSAFTGGWGSSGLYANEADEAADKKINPALVQSPATRLGLGPGAGGLTQGDAWTGLRFGSPVTQTPGLVTGNRPAAATATTSTAVPANHVGILGRMFGLTNGSSPGERIVNGIAGLFSRPAASGQGGGGNQSPATFASNLNPGVSHFMSESGNPGGAHQTAGEQANAMRKQMGMGFASGGTTKKSDHSIDDIYAGILDPQGGITGGALIPPVPLTPASTTTQPDAVSSYTGSTVTPDDAGLNQPPPPPPSSYGVNSYDPGQYGNDGSGVVPYSRGDQFQTTPDPQYSQNIGDAFKSFGAGKGLNLSPDFRQSLLAAGMGMMASKSPFALQAIGEGGLKGIETWNERQALERENAKARADIGQKGQELATTAAKTQADLINTQMTTAGNRFVMTRTPGGIIVTDPLDPTHPKRVPWGSMLDDGTIANPVTSGAPLFPDANGSAPKNGPVDPRLMDPTSAAGVFQEANQATTDARVQQQSSLAQRQQLQEMEHSLDQLPADGWLSPGAGFQTRLDYAKKIQAAAQVVGVQVPDEIVKQIAAGEDLSKVTTRLGFELSRTLGSDNAASIVESSVGAVPGGANSKEGAKRIINALEAVNNRRVDYYNFIQSWQASHNGGILGADQYFNKTWPPELYALSAYVPRDDLDYLRAHPDSAADFNKFYGNGRPVAQYVTGQ